MEHIITDIIGTTVGNIYFLGNAYNALISMIQKGPFMGFDMEDPLTGTANKFLRTIAEAANGINHAISGERYKPEGDRLLGEKKWKKILGYSIL